MDRRLAQAGVTFSVRGSPDRADPGRHGLALGWLVLAPPCRASEDDPTMKGFANVVLAPGPYDLPPELHYLSLPRAWPPRSAGRTRSIPPAPAAVVPPEGAPSPGVGPLGQAAGIDVGRSPGRPKLLVRVRAAIQMRQYSPRTEEAYVQWIRRYIFFHKLRHPDEMGAEEIGAFLSDLAVRGRVSASTQNQALCALIFLYRLLGKEVGVLGDVVRAKRPRRLPVVLTEEEVDQVFVCLEGLVLMICRLLYGSGMRLLECLGTRVKDLDFQRGEITVRDGKGRKDRVTLLPATCTPSLNDHLARVQRLHDGDLRVGLGLSLIHI